MSDNTSDIVKRLGARVNPDDALIRTDAWLAFEVKEAIAEIERLRLCAAPGRRTAHEYEQMGRPDGWTWLEHVQMYARLDQSHWDAIREVERLRAALVDAKEAVQSWGAYADSYFQEKHDLAGDIAAIDAILKGGEEGGEAKPVNWETDVPQRLVVD